MPWVAALPVALAVQAGPLAALAQDTPRPSITINYDVLNGLGARPPQAGAAASAALPALDQPPRSQLLVQPKRRAKAPPPVEAPQPTHGRPAGLLARLAVQNATTSPGIAAPPPDVAVPLVPAPPDRPEPGTQEPILPALQPPPPPPAPDAVAAPPAPPQLSDATPAPPPLPPLQEATAPAIEPPAAPEAARQAPPDKPKGKTKDDKAGGGETTTQVFFEPGSTALNETARTALAGLTPQLLDSAGGRITLRGYAPGEKRAARRLSLSRAQAVRSFLVDKGVASTRIDVRPLGATSAEGPADRVDIIAANR